jgi:death-on-curing protein
VTAYPTVDEVIAVHAPLLARFGGSLGIRDRAALESALARPRSGYYSDLIQEAAAVWESLSRTIEPLPPRSAPAVAATVAVDIVLSAPTLHISQYTLLPVNH